MLSAIALLALTAFTPTKKNVLIIGDSVSQGYTKIAAEVLTDIFWSSGSEHSQHGSENRRDGGYQLGVRIIKGQ